MCHSLNEFLLFYRISGQRTKKSKIKGKSDRSGEHWFSVRLPKNNRLLWAIMTFLSILKGVTFMYYIFRSYTETILDVSPSIQTGSSQATPTTGATPGSMSTYKTQAANISDVPEPTSIVM